MTLTTAPINEGITLNTKRVPRKYSTLIQTREQKGGQKTETTILWEFMLACFGPHNRGGLGYRLETQKRLLLDSKKRPMRNLKKAQQIALKTAWINDKLVLRINDHFELLEVVNTEQIQKRWGKVKSWLLNTYPDIKDLVAEFDSKLREDRIQGLFKADPLCNYFFGDFFNRGLPLTVQKIIANVLGTIDLPVIRQISIEDNNPETVQSTCDLDSENPDFPIGKMNAFLGELLGNSGSKRPLTFNCQGNYTIEPDTGLITEGTFSCSTEIKELYSKETKIILNIEDNG